MKEKGEGSGMKSALEIAMERLEEKSGALRPLTAAQKSKLAEIDQELTAGIAELEILTQQRILEARAVGDVDRLAELEQGKSDETARLRRQAESRKEKIRSASA